MSQRYTPRFTKKQLEMAARDELKRWKPSVNSGLVMAILWAFVHYVTTGTTIEEAFFGEKPTEPEYFI